MALGRFRLQEFVVVLQAMRLGVLAILCCALSGWGALLPLNNVSFTALQSVERSRNRILTSFRTPNADWSPISLKNVCSSILSFTRGNLIICIGRRVHISETLILPSYTFNHGNNIVMIRVDRAFDCVNGLHLQASLLPPALFDSCWLTGCWLAGSETC